MIHRTSDFPPEEAKCLRSQRQRRVEHDGRREKPESPRGRISRPNRILQIRVKPSERIVTGRKQQGRSHSIPKGQRNTDQFLERTKPGHQVEFPGQRGAQLISRTLQDGKLQKRQKTANRNDFRGNRRTREGKRPTEGRARGVEKQAEATREHIPELGGTSAGKQSLTDGANRKANQ